MQTRTGGQHEDFDDPDQGDWDHASGAVEAGIIGDAARITEQFRQAGLTRLGATEKLRESLRLESAEWMKQLQGSLFAATSLESFKIARECAASAAIADLRAIDLPKIDVTAHMLPRVEPLQIDFPKPQPRVVPAHIEALGAAADRQIDATEAQTTAIVAMHSALEIYATRSEVLAEEQAALADNRVAWGLTFSFLAAAGSVVALFDVFLR